MMENYYVDIMRKMIIINGKRQVLFLLLFFVIKKYFYFLFSYSIFSIFDGIKCHTLCIVLHINF